MKNMCLETEDYQWSPEEFRQGVAHKKREIEASIHSKNSVWRFSAPIAAESVWTLVALWELKVIAMPTPPVCNPKLESEYQAAMTVEARPNVRLRLLTSGSTGRPSVIDLTEDQLIASVEGSKKRLGCRSSDRWLCCLPLHHIAGVSILLRTHDVGATVVLQPRFDPAKVNSAIDSQNITMVSLVPSMLKRVLDDRHGRPFPDTLRLILLGGASAPKALIERCKAINAPVALTWGMTETASQIATRFPGDLRLEPDVGLPLPKHQVVVEDGKLVVLGPIAPNGRFVTNDCGYIDSEGRVIVTGRGHRLIISGGENVDPFEVEAVLARHPNIESAAVVGVMSNQWGQQVEAFLVGSPSDDIDPFIRQHLQAHQRPKRLHWVSQLPRTALGKIDRSVLIRRAEKEA